MKRHFPPIVRQYRSCLSRPIFLGQPGPRPTASPKGPVSSQAIRLSTDSATAGTTAFAWLWRLALGSGLALVLVLGAEFLSAAPLADGSAGSAAEAKTVPAAKSPATDPEKSAAPVPTGRPGPLRLTGTLVIDPNRLSRVHARFAGQVMELGRFESPAGQEPPRPLRYGDAVKKDQLLAVVWSREIGEKKSDLINATTKLAFCRTQLEHLSSLEPGVIPAKRLMDARREYESALIAAARAERTLRSWRLSEHEIAQVLAEAERAPNTEQSKQTPAGDQWARLEIRAPLDGVILEQNVSVGDLVKVGHDLFKVADLSTLGVMADVYEEDLPLIESLAATDRNWTIYVASHTQSVGIAGKFDVIGQVVDPRKHTTTVCGWVSNAGGDLRIGQLIQADLAPAVASSASSSLPRDGAAPQTALPIVQKATTRGPIAPLAERVPIGLLSAEPALGCPLSLNRPARIRPAGENPVSLWQGNLAPQCARSTPKAASSLRRRRDGVQPARSGPRANFS